MCILEFAVEQARWRYDFHTNKRPSVGRTDGRCVAALLGLISRGGGDREAGRVASCRRSMSEREVSRDAAAAVVVAVGRTYGSQRTSGDEIERIASDVLRVTTRTVRRRRINDLCRPRRHLVQ